MNSTVKTVVFWLVIVLSAVLLWQVLRTTGGPKEKEVNFSQFMADVGQGLAREVTITASQDVSGHYKEDNSPFHTTVPPNYPDMYTVLLDKGVIITVKSIASGTWSNWTANLAPLVLLAALWFFMIRQMRTAVGRRDK